MVSLNDIMLTKENIISNQKGDIKHIIKLISNGYVGFGEAYFSNIKINEIKGWKKHKKMTLNLVVPYGKIKFVAFNNNGIKFNKINTFFEVILSADNYYRLTVPPGLFLAFKGLDFNESILLNFSDIEHKDDIVESVQLERINYDWSKSDN